VVRWALHCLLARVNIEKGYFDEARKMLSKLEARLRNTDKSTWATLNWGNLFYNMSSAYGELKFREEENKFALLSLKADRKGLEISHRFMTFLAERYISSLEGLVLATDMSKQVAEFLKDEHRRLGLHVLHEQYWEMYLKSSDTRIGTLISSCANISSAITVIENIVGLYRQCKTDPWQLWSEEVSAAYKITDLRQALSKAIKVNANVTKLFGTYSPWVQPAPPPPQTYAKYFDDLSAGNAASRSR
jgi:hypothetical protein